MYDLYHFLECRQSCGLHYFMPIFVLINNTIMETSINAPARWSHTESKKTNFNLWNRWTAFTQRQAKYRTAWFLISLIVQGVFFLPLPAALTFYYGAPFYIIAITLVLFFANVISGMGGSGIRTMLNLFALSIAVHLMMVLIYV